MLSRVQPIAAYGISASGGACHSSTYSPAVGAHHSSPYVGPMPCEIGVPFHGGPSAAADAGGASAENAAVTGATTAVVTASAPTAPTAHHCRVRDGFDRWVWALLIDASRARDRLSAATRLTDIDSPSEAGSAQAY